ncbi:MAG: sodium-dependent bicarbonate transport family permease [Pseudomonadota bacterium]
MNEILSLLQGNLLTPTILFFLLGLVAAIFRSDLSIPQAAAKVMSIYLLFAIGYKGGVSIAQSGFSLQLAFTLLLSIIISLAIPFLSYGLLRLMTNLSRLDAAALSGHYGSISIVTFVTAISVLEGLGYSYEGYLIAVAAIMEAPAILSALWLASDRKTYNAALLRDIAANGSIILLLGSFFIGMLTGPDGMEEIGAFITSPFTGILCLFLLDMGLRAGRNLFSSREHINTGLISFGLLMPLLCSGIGLIASLLISLSLGGTFLMMVLCASASYIAVPAAMRLALPKANPAIFLTMSLGITFPFNIAIGLTLYLFIAQSVHGLLG